MKNRTSLTLMELSIMLLVFALAAALCLQAFVWADSQSRLSKNRDAAFLQAQNAAEVLKHHHGELTAAAGSLGGSTQNGQWTLYFDEDWQSSSHPSVFTLTVMEKAQQTPYLGAAEVSVRQADGTALAALTVSWQEVADNG